MFSPKYVLEETFGRPGAPGSWLGLGLDIVPLTLSIQRHCHLLREGVSIPLYPSAWGGRLMNRGAARAFGGPLLRMSTGGRSKRWGLWDDGMGPCVGSVGSMSWLQSTGWTPGNIQEAGVTPDLRDR